MDPKAVNAAYQAILRLGAAEAFKLAWCRETARPDLQAVWDAKTPMRGQCDVTALMVRELAGGEIMRCDVIGYGHHYYNVLPDGTELDLTVGQFPAMLGVPRGKPVDPDDILSSAEGRKNEVEERRDLLSELIYEALADLRQAFDILGLTTP